MQIRLRELGFSLLGASKLGILSRSTLTSLRDADRVPNLQTLAKLDDLLVWEPGSARAVLHGGDPVPRERGVYRQLPKSTLPEEQAGSGVTLDTLFTPDAKALNVIFPIVQRDLERQTGLTGVIATSDGLDPSHYQNFAVTDDAVIFFFSQGELLPSDAGATSASVPRAALPPLQLN